MAAHAPGFVELFNPIARRVLKAGALLGPNALITIRGRTSGEPRTTPVALVEIDGHRWIIGTFGETNWVRNLRAAGEAELEIDGQRRQVKAVELTREQAADFFTNVIVPYVARMPRIWRVGVQSLI